MFVYDFIVRLFVFYFLRDPCIQNPCQNGGTCHYTYSAAPYCSCASNFTGLTCNGTISFDSYFYDETVKSGGETVDHCLSSPCLNNGACSSTETGYMCTCTIGYKGQNCETSGGEANDPCLSSPCLNNGTCSAATETSYQCACPIGYTGHNCEASSLQGVRTVDHCFSAPCLNNGTCSSTETSYTCVCVIGYTGENCQTTGGETIDPCLVSPCLNNGTCSANGTIYTCACLDGYTGRNCETLSKIIPVLHESASALTNGGGDHCFSAPCLNSGTCLPTETSYTCSCSNGYAGQNCETSDPLDLCFSRPCHNNGICSHDGNDYKCECATGFTGRDCETPTVDPCSPDPCLNEGQCYTDASDASDYYCACTKKYRGKNCDIYKN